MATFFHISTNPVPVQSFIWFCLRPFSPICSLIKEKPYLHEPRLCHPFHREINFRAYEKTHHPHHPMCQCTHVYERERQNRNYFTARRDQLGLSIKKQHFDHLSQPMATCGSRFVWNSTREKRAVCRRRRSLSFVGEDFRVMIGDKFRDKWDRKVR